MGTPVLMEEHLQRAGRLIREEEARAEQAGQAPDFQAVLSEQIHLARLDDGECYVMLIHLYGLLEVRSQCAVVPADTPQPALTEARP